jgi:glutamate racemase
MAESKSNQPIGIFDSGIGGLTVANAIQEAMPNESLIYFGDTAHFPYGEKSPEAIESYSIKIADFLIKNNCKMIVIACNTASSIAYEAVKKHLAGKAPVVSVIDPVVKAVSDLYTEGRIGVIATKATVKSDMYNQKIMEQNSKLEVMSLATPLLAPMIEEGFYNNKISKTIIESYLSKPKLKKIDALILACTHYPLIRKEIEEYYKNKVKIIDSAEIVAAYTKALLKKENLLTTKTTKKHHFYVSDYTQSFEQSSRFFFKGKIQLEHYHLWKD